MPDREKVIKEFADYVNYFKPYCIGDVEDHEMLKDVLALLKEQEESIPVSWLTEKLEGHPELSYAVTDGINNVLDLWEGR